MMPMGPSVQHYSQLPSVEKREWSFRLGWNAGLRAARLMADGRPEPDASPPRRCHSTEMWWRGYREAMSREAPRVEFPRRFGDHPEIRRSHRRR